MEEEVYIPKGLLKRKKKNIKKDLPKSIFAGNENSVPEKIVIFYKNDIDLSIIDKTIKHKLKKMKDNVREIVLEVSEYKKKLSESKTTSERKYYKKLIQKKLRLIDDLNNDRILEQYINGTEEFIKKYSEDKNIVVAELYLEEAKKYIEIEKIKEVKNNYTCKNCEADILELSEDVDGFYVCGECNSLNQFLKPNKYDKDLENYNSGTEEDTNNFIKIIDKFEGKNTVYIHNELYDELDKYFVDIGMEKSEYYKKLPLTEHGKKEGTSKKFLRNALEHLGYNQYYDETSYIAHIYWGWKLPDLSLYRDRIIKDYQNSQQVWYKIRGDYNRSASLGTQFRLFSHLRSVGYPHCDEDDFKIQDMVDSLRFHNHAGRRMFEEIGIKFYEVS